MLHKGEIMSSAILDDPSHENRMSFDDLEQVYKNISRRNILNKVTIQQLLIPSTLDTQIWSARQKVNKLYFETGCCSKFT